MEHPAQILALLLLPAGDIVTHTLTHRAFSAPQSTLNLDRQGDGCGQELTSTQVPASSTHTCLLGPSWEGCPLRGGWAAGVRKGNEQADGITPRSIHSAALKLDLRTWLYCLASAQHVDLGWSKGFRRGGESKHIFPGTNVLLIITNGLCHVESKQSILQRRVLKTLTPPPGEGFVGHLLSKKDGQHVQMRIREQLCVH